MSTGKADEGGLDTGELMGLSRAQEWGVGERQGFPSYG